MKWKHDLSKVKYQWIRIVEIIYLNEYQWIRIVEINYLNIVK